MPLFRRRNNPTPDPIERIHQLCEQPEKWHSVSTDDLQLMLVALIGGVHHADREATPADVSLMSALYTVARERLTRDERIEVLILIFQGVERGQSGVSALLPFIHAETDPSVISTAALHIASVHPAFNDDPLTGPKFVLHIAESIGSGEKRAAILRGLFMLGDRRILPLLVRAWGFLDDDEREEWCYTYSGGISAVVVEFFLARLEELDARADGDLFIAVVGALASLPSEAETPVVQDLERKFPVNAPDGRPEISVIGEWSIKEYGRKIEPRLRVIMAREPETLPQLLDAWGIPQHGEAAMTITVEQPDGSGGTLPPEVLASALETWGTDENGAGALHHAVRRGDQKLIELLLARGADIEARDNDDVTPLFIAATIGHQRIVEQLLERGADIEARDWAQQTPLHYAAIHGQSGMVATLLDHGADIDAQSDKGSTPLHMAASKGDVDTTEILLKNGSSTAAHGKDGRTPLHYAALNDCQSVAELLLAHGADINASDSDGRTPLHYAAGNGYGDLVKMLVAHGSDIDARDRENRTPLHYADAYDHQDVVAMLATRVVPKESARSSGRKPNAKKKQAPVAPVVNEHATDAQKEIAAKIRSGAKEKPAMNVTVEQPSGEIEMLPPEILASTLEQLRTDGLLSEKSQAAIALVDGIVFRHGEGNHLLISIEADGAHIRAHNFSGEGGHHDITWYDQRYGDTNEFGEMAGPGSPMWIELQPLLSALCAVVAPGAAVTTVPGFAEISLSPRGTGRRDSDGENAGTEAEGSTIGGMSLEEIAAEREKGWWLDLQDERINGSPVDETDDSVARREEMVRDAMADVEAAAEARGMTIQFEHAITGLLFSVKSIYVMPSNEEYDRITQFAKELAAAFEFNQYTVHRLVP